MCLSADIDPTRCYTWHGPDFIDEQSLTHDHPDLLSMPPPTVFVLKRAYQATRNALDDHLRSCGLTVAQWDVLKLMLIPEGSMVEPPRGGIDQRAIQAELGVTSATLTRLLMGMEYRGLIRRSPHPQDSRSKRVSPTSKGTKLVAKLMEEGEAAFYERLFRGFTNKETRLLGQMLERIVKNLRPTAQGFSPAERFGPKATRRPGRPVTSDCQ